MKLGERLSMQSEAFNRQLGEDIEAADAAGMDLSAYRTKKHMAKLGIPWTRENYIAHNWLMAEDIPEEWDESELPEDLQDWSKGRP